MAIEGPPFLRGGEAASEPVCVHPFKLGFWRGHAPTPRDSQRISDFVSRAFPEGANFGFDCEVHTGHLVSSPEDGENIGERARGRLAKYGFEDGGVVGAREGGLQILGGRQAAAF